MLWVHMAEEEEEQPDYEDGRETGDWESRYGRRAWLQIIIECLILFIYLIVANYLLLEAITE